MRGKRFYVLLGELAPDGPRRPIAATKDAAVVAVAATALARRLGGASPLDVVRLLDERSARRRTKPPVGRRR